jgi:RNA polymerase sigma-70 factor (TIGR02943 family)
MGRQFPGEERQVGRRLAPPGEWVGRYGDALYRYALSRLHRSHEAEEVVQETFLTALAVRDQFAGRSDPLSWLMGILRNKIAGRLRATARQGTRAEVDDLDAWFDSSGHWRKPTVRWTDPAELAERQDFWRVVRDCLAKLPTGMAEAFTLRTLDDCDPAEVCQTLAISSANLWVLLHRARLRLVRCLQIHWFDAKE